MVDRPSTAVDPRGMVYGIWVAVRGMVYPRAIEFSGFGIPAKSAPQMSSFRCERLGRILDVDTPPRAHRVRRRWAPAKEMPACDVVIDVGESSVTCALLSGRTATGRTWTRDERYCDHSEYGHRTPSNRFSNWTISIWPTPSMPGARPSHRLPPVSGADSGHP